MNPLLFAATNFSKLLNIEYVLVLGRKNKLFQINIRFEKSRFHHLGGFQYLEDMRDIMRHERKLFFEKIITEEIKYENLSESSHYPIVEKRLECISQLENLLSDNRLTFHYSFKKRPGSRIKADYLLKGELNGKIVYFFVSKNELTSSYSGTSIFYEDGCMYEEGQTKYTTLQIIKRNLMSGEENIIYSSPSFKTQQQGNQ